MIPVRIYAYIALVVAVLAGLYGYGSNRYDAGKAATQALWDKDTVRLQTVAIQETQSNAKETARRLDKQQGSQNENTAFVNQAHVDAFRAGALSVREPALKFAADHRAATSHPAAGSVGAPADDAISVLADLFSRADDRAADLAKYADEAHAAGSQCERDYNSLTR